LIQKPDCLGTVGFTDEQKTAHQDNVLLMTDTGTTEGEIAVTFTIGPERGTAPGLFLSPKVKDGVVRSAVCMFVADYTIAIWYATTDPKTNKTKYKHLVRLARGFKTGKKHVLRCRFSKRRKSIAVQIDDSDVIVLRDLEINSRVGIWGCHGTCDYYQAVIRSGGTLPWTGKKPGK